MYQKEVAEKILPNDPRNAMGSLHSLCLSQFEISQVVHAPPGAFVPPPKVDSLVLNFKRRPVPHIPLTQVDQFEKFLRVTFAQRRKQLGGILKKEYGPEVSLKSLADVSLSPEIRAEALTFNEVLKLYEAFTLNTPVL